MWVVIDHLRGTRRGQRQELELELENRISIGRHPDCEVSFDTRRDLEASTRHAELRTREGDVVLVDVGSSNGTYLGGERVSEVPLPPGKATIVEFGADGPRLRIWWDPVAEPSAGPPLPTQGAPKLILALVAVAVVILAAALRWLL